MIHKPVKYLRLVIYLALPLSCWNLIWAKIDFNRQIRPILSDKCFKCHGPDAKNQKSDFRLDTFDQAIQEHNGFVGLTPGSLEDSEIHWRIHTDDEIELMPPPSYSASPFRDASFTCGTAASAGRTCESTRVTGY